MKIRALAVTLILAVSGLCGLSVLEWDAMAVTCPPGSLNAGSQPTLNSVAECNIPKKKATDPTVAGTAVRIINVVVGVVGVVTVGVIVLGGISYATSQGDSAKITKAKNTILYGIVGLVICMLAFAIVNFVLGNVFGTAKTSDTTTDTLQEKSTD